MGKKIAFAAAVIVVSCVPLLWPGDAPFISDEPKQLLLAYDLNQIHALADASMRGSVGLPYGPLSTWAYQLILAITATPSLWVLIQALIIVVGIAAGLLLIARATGLWKWFVPMAFGSPYIWFDSRHLVVVAFLLPFSALAVGAYAGYLSSRSSKALLCAFGIALLLPLIHLMALPLSAAMLLHMALFARRQTWQVLASGAVIAGVVVVLHLGYFSLFLSGLGSAHPHAVQEGADYWKGLLFPLLGGRSLSGWGLEYYFGTDWLPRHPAFLLLKSISGLAYLFVFAGMYFAGRMIWENRRQLLFSKHGAKKPVSVDTKTHISLIALAALPPYMALCGLLRLFSNPNYYNGVWIVYVLLAWISIDRITTRRWAAASVAVYGVSCVALVVALAVLVHERGGTRGISYGPTIGNQMEIVRDIGSEDRDDIYCTVENFVHFPSLVALRTISLNGEPGRKQGPLVIEFATDDLKSGFVRTRSVAK